MPALSDIVNLTDDEENVDDSENELLADFGDAIEDEATDDDASGVLVDSLAATRLFPQIGQSSKGRSTIRNGPVEYPFSTLPKLPLDQWTSVQAGDVVELHPKDGFDHGDFLLIRDIIENVQTGEKKLRGLRLRRTKYVGGALDRKLNEVFIKIEEDEDDDRDPFIQGAIEVPQQEVLRKRNLIFSADDFPVDSYREIWSPELAASERNTVRESARLVCRWVLVHTFESAAARTRTNPKPKATEGYLRRIESVECVNGVFIPGGPTPRPRQQTSTHGRNWRSRPQGAVKKAPYTYGTGCCGAGGDAEGARMAGLRVVYGWDHDHDACKSFKLNHPRASVYKCEAVAFPIDPDLNLYVDIMHLSLPCCYFSPAHTIEGKDDDANIATFLAAKRILTDTRPIIHTQENTFGLFSHHPEYFATLLWMITSSGYNVRWKVVQFKDYGLPASRKRLIIIASLRGYPTPKFPAPSRRRFIHDAIGNIPPGATLHYEYVRDFDVPRMPYNAREATANCICTRPDESTYHPSGKRRLTPRELACIQGFRCDYQFHGNLTAVQKQIGNAVPPYVGKQFNQQIAQTLDKFYDGKIDQFGNSIPQQLSVPNSAQQVNSSMGIIRSSTVAGPSKMRGLSHARSSMSTSTSVIGVKRGGISNAGIDRLAARTRAISIDDDAKSNGSVIMIEDSDDDLVLVETPRKRVCKGKGKETVIDLTR